MELIRLACCGATWVGAERAHCCRRFGGCGAVFDDAELWDAHRRAGRCLDPLELALVQTKNGIWLRPFDQAPAERPPSPRAARRDARRSGPAQDGATNRAVSRRRQLSKDGQAGTSAPAGRAPAHRSRRAGGAG